LKYTDFSNEFLVAAYHESRLRPDETIPSRDIIDRYPLTFEPGWVVSLARDLGVRGYFVSKGADTDDRGQPIRLTGRGLRVAEDLIKKGVEIFRLDLGDGVGFPSARVDSRIEEKRSEEVGVPPVDSSSWTGLPRDFRLTEARRVSLVRALDKAEEVASNLPLGQEAQAQLRAYIGAARVLAEAPEPQPDLIWELVNRADALAGVASLFVSILALFT
jgi:hypothetical protein